MVINHRSATTNGDSFILPYLSYRAQLNEFEEVEDWEEFSKKEEYRLLKDEEVYFAVLDRYPKITGHTLIISKQQCDDITDLRCDHDLSNFFKGVVDISRILKTNLPRCEKVYVMSMCEHWEPWEIDLKWKEGQKHPRTTEHLHFHLLPRYKDMRNKDLAAEKLFIRPEDKDWTPDMLKA